MVVNVVNVGKSFHTGRLEVERQTVCRCFAPYLLEVWWPTSSVAIPALFYLQINGQKLQIQYIFLNKIQKWQNGKVRYIVRYKSDVIFPKALCIYLMLPSAEEPTERKEFSVQDTPVQCCYSISALGRRQQCIITLFPAATCHGVYMHTWQAGLEWKCVVHWGKLLPLLSLVLPLFNLKMWYSSDKTPQQDWVSILKSNSSRSCVGIDFPFACSSSSTAGASRCAGKMDDWNFLLAIRLIWFSMFWYYNQWLRKNANISICHQCFVQMTSPATSELLTNRHCFSLCEQRL